MIRKKINLKSERERLLAARKYFPDFFDKYGALSEEFGLYEFATLRLDCNADKKELSDALKYIYEEMTLRLRLMNSQSTSDVSADFHIMFYRLANQIEKCQFLKNGGRLITDISLFFRYFYTILAKVSKVLPDYEKLNFETMTRENWLKHDLLNKLMEITVIIANMDFQDEKENSGESARGQLSSNLSDFLKIFNLLEEIDIAIYYGTFEYRSIYADDFAKYEANVSCGIDEQVEENEKTYRDAYETLMHNEDAQKVLVFRR